MSKKDLKKNNVNTAANELSEDILGSIAGGQVAITGGPTLMICLNCNHQQMGNHGTHVQCPVCKESYLIPKETPKSNG